MLITVLITFYSKKNGLLIKAVKSALCQEYKNIEVLIIDDCSPIQAKDELSEVLDSRVKIYKNSKNIGMAESINRGLEIASGDLVAFLDYDDIWFSFKLADQLKLYMDSKNVRTVVYSKAEIYSRGASFIKPKKAIGNDSVSEYLFTNNGFIQTSGILMNRQIAKNVGMDNFRRHTDYQFCLSLENYGCNFQLLNKVSYRHVVSPKLVDYNLSICWLDTYKHLFTGNSIEDFKKGVILKLILAHGHYRKAISYSKENKLGVSLLIKIIVANIVKRTFPKGCLKLITKVKNL